MSKPKVHVVLFLGNDSYYNTPTYFSDDKQALDDIRKDLETEGLVWDVGTKNYPLVFNIFIEHNPHLFSKYFFFRTLNDVCTGIDVHDEESIQLINMYTVGGDNVGFFVNHPCKYVSLIAKNLEKHNSLYDITVEILNSPKIGV